MLTMDYMNSDNVKGITPRTYKESSRTLHLNSVFAASLSSLFGFTGYLLVKVIIKM